MAEVTLAALRRIILLPEDDELLVRANAALQTLTGTTLALGLAPRVSAIALFGSMVPTTIAGHRFWAIQDTTSRRQHRTQFHKNMAMLGGLLFAVLDRPVRGSSGIDAMR
jgi:putative oxidoreductase